MHGTPHLWRLPRGDFRGSGNPDDPAPATPDRTTARRFALKVIRGWHNVRPEHHGCVATIGNFDGVHLGHRALIGQLAALGRERGVPATLVTFEPQPQEFFAGENAPPRLTRLREKLTAPPYAAARSGRTAALRRKPLRHVSGRVRRVVPRRRARGSGGGRGGTTSGSGIEGRAISTSWSRSAGSTASRSSGGRPSARAAGGSAAPGSGTRSPTTSSRSPASCSAVPIPSAAGSRAAIGAAAPSDSRP